jgi:hypothetical protein
MQQPLFSEADHLLASTLYDWLPISARVNRESVQWLHDVGTNFTDVHHRLVPHGT